MYLERAARVGSDSGSPQIGATAAGYATVCRCVIGAIDRVVASTVAVTTVANCPLGKAERHLERVQGIVPVIGVPRFEGVAALMGRREDLDDEEANARGGGVRRRAGVQRLRLSEWCGKGAANSTRHFCRT